MAVVEGRLSREDEALWAEHVEHCSACQQTLTTLAGGAEWLPRETGEEARCDTPATPALARAIEQLSTAGSAARAAEERQAPPPEKDLAELGDYLDPPVQPGYLGRLATYEVIDVIGRGGMGTVLRAHDPALNRVVAIKVLAPQLAANAAARKRFVREAQAAAAISHDHVVTIHAVDEFKRLPYLVMQYVPGKSLEQRLAANGPLELKEILRIGMQTAAGLAAAHAQGLVHRDIKPANILLENGIERVKITDFGLARAVDDVGVTQTGVVAGTPQYMAPEQARGERVDFRADVFSLGALVYAMCTGRPPFQGSTALAVIRRVCEEEPPPIRQLNADIPAWLAELVQQLMAKDPSRRELSAADVAHMLGQQLARVQQPATPDERIEPIGKRPKRLPTLNRRLRRLLVGAVVLLPMSLASLLCVTEFSGLTRFFAPAQKADDTAPDQPAESVHPPPNELDFRLLGEGQRSQGYPSLESAIAAARSGDTIEGHRDGPFSMKPTTIIGKSLTIRAAKGYRPMLVAEEVPLRDLPLLTTNSDLTLEGLGLRIVPQSRRVGRDVLGAAGGSRERPTPRPRAAIVVQGARGKIDHCQFYLRHPLQLACLSVEQSPRCEVSHSFFVTTGGIAISAIRWEPAPEGQLVVENSICAGMAGILVARLPSKLASINLTGDTFCGAAVIRFAEPAARDEVVCRIEASNNVFDATRVISHQFATTESLSKTVSWHGRQNRFAASVALIGAQPPGAANTDVASLDAWNRLWGQPETGSVEGPPPYVGDPRAKLRQQPFQLVPLDFRLTNQDMGAPAANVGPMASGQ